LSSGKTLSISGLCWTDPSRRRSLEQLLQEEAKLKKYDADNKKESPGSSKPGLIDHALIAPAA
jgi:hypothetical protein